MTTFERIEHIDSGLPAACEEFALEASSDAPGTPRAEEPGPPAAHGDRLAGR